MYRRSRRALRCRNAKGSQTNFKDRILFYTANLIQVPGKSVDGDWDYKLSEVYFIAVMDFAFEDTPVEQYIHDVRLVEMSAKKEFYDKLGQHLYRAAKV